MFFLMPIALIVLIYILAAVLPAVFLLRYIYKKDWVEKESPKLLKSLLLNGVLAALLSIAGESLGTFLLNLSPISPESPVYYIVMAFLVVAVVEEGMKYILMYRRTWNDPEFNYTFDAIVYAVFISLGFAAFENIQYVFGYGLAVALPRAFLSIPGHMAFAVVSGCFYGRAKRASLAGDQEGKNVNLILGYLSSVALHGFYDSCAMIGTGASTLLFIVFIVWMYVMMFNLVKKASREDAPLW